MKDTLSAALIIGYWLGSIATFGKLTFFNCYAYTWWNWIIVLPLNAFISGVWPGYWLVVRPLFGGGC